MRLAVHWDACWPSIAGHTVPAGSVLLEGNHAQKAGGGNHVWWKCCLRKNFFCGGSCGGGSFVMESSEANTFVSKSLTFSITKFIIQKLIYQLYWNAWLIQISLLLIFLCVSVRPFVRPFVIGTAKGSSLASSNFVVELESHWRLIGSFETPKFRLRMRTAICWAFCRVPPHSYAASVGNALQWNSVDT